MNQKTKDFVLHELIPALRSGAYEQTIQTLKDSGAVGTAYCCLGVVCDLYAKGDPEHVYWNPSIPYQIVIKSDEHDCVETESSWLPVAIADDLGWSTTGPDVVIDGQTMNLMAANDDGYSFAHIADALEAWVQEQETKE